ncbi:MAG TPA: hypothetical protein VE685_09965 [Thermoanaerobaculia bacterium]|nr:hypothetical protein [Thermoanaerobaculia bacterium]
MDNHPTVEELERLVFGGNPAGRNRAVIAHLLRGCGVCNGLLAPYFPFLFDGQGRRGALPAHPEIYDEAVDRAFAAVQRAGAALPPRRRTPEEIKRNALELLAAGGLDALGDAPLDIQGVPLCEALLEQSWALRHQSPPEMAQLAQAVVLVADRLNDPGLDPEKVIHLRCRAWTELGNARRVNDELDRAAEALSRAAELVRAGCGDELLTARFFTVLGSFYGARRHFELALATFAAAADVYQQHGDQHLVARTLIKKGIYTGYSGDAEEAVRLLRQGLSSLDEGRDPGLAFSAGQSLARFLLDCGLVREARIALWDLRRRYPELGGRVNELKIRWLEGQIGAGAEKLELAEQAFREVKEGFEEEGLNVPFKAALVGLELGAVWLRQGRNTEAAGVVLKSTEVFQSLRIEREVLASILVLQKAAAGNRLTLGLLNPIIERLRQSDRD